MDTTDGDPSKQDESSPCCEAERSVGDRTPDTHNWIDADDVLDAPLPGAVQSALGRFVGAESIESLGAWATAIRRLTGGGSIDVDHLCHADGETDHWGIAGDDRYYFLCFYDAVILAAIEDRPVDIHTVSPEGTVVEARAVGTDDLSVTPAGAVFSLGIRSDAHDASGGEPTLQDGYQAICPSVKAFPDRAAYAEWAGRVPAATVAMPLAGATAVAGALVD